MYVHGGVKASATGDSFTANNFATLNGGGIHIGTGATLTLSSVSATGNVTSGNATNSGYDVFNNGTLSKNSTTTIDKLAGLGPVVNF